MVRYIFIIILIGTGLQAQQQEEIVKALFESRDAWNEGNIEKYMETYWKSDSLLFVGSKGLTYGWEQTLKNYKKSYSTREMMGYLEFTVHKVDIFNDSSAFVLGGWKVVRQIGEIGGYFTLVWKKINGKWLIIIDHSS